MTKQKCTLCGGEMEVVESEDGKSEWQCKKNPNHLMSMSDKTREKIELMKKKEADLQAQKAELAKKISDSLHLIKS